MVLYCIVLYLFLQLYVYLYCIVLVVVVVSYCTSSYCIVLYFIILCSVVLVRSIVLCSMVLYGTVLYCATSLLLLSRAWPITPTGKGLAALRLTRKPPPLSPSRIRCQRPNPQVIGLRPHPAPQEKPSQSSDLLSRNYPGP